VKVKVTPLDIRQKEFKRAVRGYAEEEVDLFLDEIADELEQLSKESAELVERLRRQEGELSSNQQLRDALEKILVSAQLQADETRAKAAQEAEQVVRSAESRARDLVSESYAEVQRVQQALVQLKHLEEDFRSKFQSLLQNHLRVLAEPAIALPVTEAVVTPTPTPAVTPASAPPVAAAPAAATAPVAAAISMPETPFVVPTSLEQVPEFQRVPDASTTVAASVQAVAENPAQVAPEGPVATAPEAPESAIPAVLQPPASLVWSDETGDSSEEDTETTDQGAVVQAADDDLTVSMSDAPTVVSDDAANLGIEDPLHGFFFSGKDDPAADAVFGDKSKPRDFEW